MAALAAAAWAAEAPIPPAPKQYVTDTAGFLSPQTVRALNERLKAYERATGHQVVVWIGRSTGDTPLEEWAVRAFEKWQVGRKGIDDGVLLAIMADDRKMRFEVGYGLEGDVPDVVAWRIIDEVMAPRLKAGDRDGAVTAGIDALLGKIGGEKAGAAGKPDRRVQPHRERPSLGQMILFGIIGIIFLFILITNPSLALYLLWAIGSGGRGGGYGGGGGGGDRGGFSGGGGRSGGGGASGGW